MIRWSRDVLATAIGLAALAGLWLSSRLAKD